MALRNSKQLAACIECDNADLWQRGNDPIIAACLVKNGDRDVARMPKLCDKFTKRVSEPIIKQILP